MTFLNRTKPAAALCALSLALLTAGTVRGGDAAALQRRVDANRCGVVRVPAGVYELTQPLFVTNNCSLEFEKGAILRAVRRMDYVIRFIQCGPVRETGVHVTGGVLDGNGLASCMLVQNFYHPTLRDISFHNGFPYGLHVQSPGCETVAENLYFRTYLRGLAGNTALFVRASDSHFIDCIAVDYTTGVYNKGGANRYTRAHIWSGPVPPAKPGELPEMMKNSVCFEDEGGGTIWRDCYADSGEIGFLLRGHNLILDGCNYFNNTVFNLDHVTAIAQPARGSNALVSHMTFNKTAKDFRVYRGVGRVVWRDCVYNGFEPGEDCPGDAFAQTAATAPAKPRPATNIVTLARTAAELAARREAARRHGLPQTILLSSDALKNGDLAKRAFGADRTPVEFGVWLAGATPAARAAEIGAAADLFEKRLGTRLAVVGAKTFAGEELEQLARTRNITVFCLDSEGDDSLGAYYPSRANARVPAALRAEIVPVTVVRANVTAAPAPQSLARLAEARAAGRLDVETLGASARKFADAFVENPSRYRISEGDVRFRSRLYRANLKLDGGRLWLRDVRTTRQGFSGDAEFVGAYERMKIEEVDGDALIVTARRPDGAETKIIFSDWLIKILDAEVDFRSRDRKVAEKGGTVKAKDTLSTEGLGVLAARREKAIRLEYR